MSNSGFLITDAGLAAASIADPEGPYVHITAFKVGSGVNYAPTRDMTDLQGTELYAGVPSAYNIVSENAVEVVLLMDASVGTFQFGEIGIYLETGELFALCVFDNLQEKIRWVGNQAGNTWRIRSRIKLAQAPAIVEVTLINSQGILEVPSWQLLAKPIDQIMGANVAIVHDNNSSDDPVLVIRDNDDEWGLVDYARIFTGGIADVGATLTANSFTHPDLQSIFLEDMPRTDSRYVVKFPNGQIRKIAGTPTLSQITWTPGVSTAQTGNITVWAEHGGQQRISWADTAEYNAFAADFNPYWITAQGPYRVPPNNAAYPAANKGKSQAAIPILNRRTNGADWAILMDAVRRNCQIHGISIADIADVVDFVYRPIGPNFPGMETLRLQWQALIAKIPLLESNRNVFDTGVQDQSLIVTSSDNTFWTGTRNWRHQIDYLSEGHLAALLNAGHSLQLAGFMEDIDNGDWYEFQSLLAAAGTITIAHGNVTASAGAGVGIGLQNMPAVETAIWSYTAFNWNLTIYGQKPAGQNRFIITARVNNTGTSPYAYTADPPGEINFDVFSRRPPTSLINNPELPHPTASFTIVP